MLYNNNLRQFFRRAILIFSLAIFSSIVSGQVYTNKEVGKKNAAVKDSPKKIEYPYNLPIWGKKVAKLGYNLPYSAGLSVNYLWQKSDLVIENLNVGFNNGPMYNLDQVIRFNKAVSEANVVNIRPDVWILPFLNIYGIFASSKPSTTVGFGIWIPDSSNNWKQITPYETKANFTATSVGFGLTPTIGVGGGWLALDMNFTWTDVSALDKPAFSYIFGPRLGKSFKFKKPEQNIALWAGGFRVKFGSAANGSVSLSEVVAPDGEAAAKIDAGQQTVAETQVQVDVWWNSLTSPSKTTRLIKPNTKLQTMH